MADARHEAPRDATDSSAPDAADDFEFRVAPTGGLVPGAADEMCVADELFSHGKLLPLRPSSTAAADAAPGAVLLPRSDSAAGLGSRHDWRSASSSGSSSGCVSRSHSLSSEQGAAAAPPRRSLSSGMFYAHPSPSPRLRPSRPRRSTGSAPAPPAGWGVIRLGVVGAPGVYPPRPGDARITAASRGGSARFERAASAIERSFRKHGAGLFGDGFGCRCSPDDIAVVEPAGLPEAARKGGADGGVRRGRSARRSRIMDWLEELSITKGKK